MYLRKRCPWLRYSSAANSQVLCLPPATYYANSIGYPSESVSSSNWHVWFASRYPGRCLSTWQMTAASCPTALDALCGQLSFRLVWCRENTQQLRRQNVCSRWTSLVEFSSGPAAQSRHHLYGLFRRQLKRHLFGKHENGAL